MSVILLRLEGPMQSWGIDSRFSDRYTEAEPSKSGVIGLISSALGHSREKELEELVKMKMAIRVDREGKIVHDFHTVLNVVRADAKGEITPSKIGTVVSRRFYIEDACFTVGLESKDETLLININKALRQPKWPLFLGRKSYPPISPISLSDQVFKGPLEEVIKKLPWQGREHENQPDRLRFITECGLNDGEPRFDVPISFSPRKFRSRNVRTEFISIETQKQEV